MARPLRVPLAMSRGRRLLLALLQLTSAREVAARCRVQHQRIADWSSGLHTPNAEARAQLERNYGIRREAWDTAWADTVSRHSKRYRMD